jgi:hypothetical protein
MAKLADEGWTIIAWLPIQGGAEQRDVWYVGVGTEREAMGKVQEQYMGDMVTMLAARLSPNSLAFLKLEEDAVRSGP